MFCGSRERPYQKRLPYLLHWITLFFYNAAAMRFPKIELHVHLDGAIRFETLFELCKTKNMDLGVKSAEELRKLLICTEANDLSKMLEAFLIFLPLVRGDPDAIERISYEFCKDQAKSGVIYFEARYSPHELCNTAIEDTKRTKIFRAKGPVTPEQVVEAVTRGFERGERDFKVKARQLLCCIRAQNHWSSEVLDLVKKFYNKGVVGIDIAGAAHAGATEVFTSKEIEAFTEAKRLGIHRTVHAGESGTADDVEFAVDRLFAERIGHGYHAQDDDDIYARLLKKKIHFETCPLSSVMTGSATGNWEKHPIKRFAADGANFSLNTDDPTCLGNWLNDELLLAKDKLGFSDTQIWQCQLNGAESCFLPENEKLELIEQIRSAKPTSM